MRRQHVYWPHKFPSNVYDDIVRFNPVLGCDHTVLNLCASANILREYMQRRRMSSRKKRREKPHQMNRLNLKQMPLRHGVARAHESKSTMNHDALAIHFIVNGSLCLFFTLNIITLESADGKGKKKL